MKVLVTGASGFLGSHIVDACLLRGFEVRVIVRPASNCDYLKTLGNAIELWVGELTDRAFLDRCLKNIDVVIHSAARVTDVGHWNLFYQANITITDLLLEMAKCNGVKRFVFVSSPSAVAELRDQINIDESYPYPQRFLNYYCETKAIAEQHVLAANAPGFMTCALRPRGIWGPRDTAGPIAKFMKKMNQGRLKNLSGGRKIITSMCHVKNAAHACINACTAVNVAGKAYFITDAEPVELWSFADHMANIFGIPRIQGQVPTWLLTLAVPIIELIWCIPYLRNNVPPPASRYAVGLVTHNATYNIARARQDLDYAPIVTLEEGMSEFKAWVDSIGGLESYLSRVP